MYVQYRFSLRGKFDGGCVFFSCWKKFFSCEISVGVVTYNQNETQNFLVNLGDWGSRQKMAFHF
jgi:hypothetical protein